MSWRREGLPTPVFLLGVFHGQRSLAGYSPWSHNDLNMTDTVRPVHTYRSDCVSGLRDNLGILPFQIVVGVY